MATGHKVEGEQARQVTDELAAQGFNLAWTQLTASPVTWLGQVFDAAGEELTSGIGDDPLEMLAGRADRLLPHHPG
jgi:hypothetical protein